MSGKKNGGDEAATPEEEKKPESGGSEVAVKPESAVSVYGSDANLGFDQASGADYALPFLTILQSNSPQVEEGDQQMKDAKAGMLMDTVSNELFGADDGVIFVPCDRQHVFVEWVPRDKGGGFVGIHAPDSEIITKAKREAKEFGKYSSPEGNDLVETFYVYGMLLRAVDDVEPAGMFVIAFKSTQIKKYKQMMYRLRTFKGNAPLFAHRLRIASMPDQNKKGKFRSFRIEPAIDNSLAASLIPPTIGEGDDAEQHPLLVQGKFLNEQVRSGLARADFSTERKAGDGEGSGDSHF